MIQIKKFLEAIFSGTREFIEIRTINSKREVRLFFYPTDQIDRLISHLTDDDSFNGVNVFFGVCPRNTKRGKEENIKQLNCLWVDLDCGDKKERQERLEKLRDSELPPSIIVNSGHGLHCYWLLNKPHLIKDSQDRLNTKGYLKGLSLALKGDKTFDLCRILRVPGTKNLKDLHNPLPVKILDMNPERRYNLTDFDSFKVKIEDSVVEVDITPEDTPDRFWRILQEDPKLKASWEGKREDLKDKSRSGYDMALANLLMPYKFTDSEIAAILRISPSGKQEEGKKQYLAHTIGKARRDWEKKRPLTLRETLGTFQKWLELEETDYIKVAFATLVSNKIPGDPVWLFIIGPPGASKTEVIRSFNGLAEIGKVYITSKLTPKSLISGWVSKKAKFDPSLMPKLDGKTLLIKDFTSILSMQRESREQVFSDLREAYDGYLDRDLGNLGHKGFFAHFSVIAGVTPIIDRYSSFQQHLGERFLKIRLKELDINPKIQKAIENEMKQKEMREELTNAVKQLFRQEFNLKDVKLSKEMKDHLVHLANFSGICRTTVSRDPYQQNILTDIPEYEIGTRIGIQLAKLGRSLATIDNKQEVGSGEYEILKRVAKDTIPNKTRILIEFLYNHSRPVWFTTEEVVEGVNVEERTCRRALDDLLVLNLVSKKTIKGRGNPYGWRLTEKIESLLRKIDF